MRKSQDRRRSKKKLKPHKETKTMISMKSKRPRIDKQRTKKAKIQ